MDVTRDVPRKGSICQRTAVSLEAQAELRPLWATYALTLSTLPESQCPGRARTNEVAVLAEAWM